MKFKGMEKVGDLLLLNLLFVVCSLGIVTIGASETAMYYALGRLQRQEGTVVKDFFRGFRENFKQATLYWCILLVIVAALYWNFRLVSQWTGAMYSVFMVLLILVAFCTVCWGCMVFPLLSRFDNTAQATAKNAGILALAVPLRTLAAVAIHALPVALAVFLPGIFLVTGILWLFCLFSFGDYGILRLLSPVFAQLEKPEQTR